MKKKILSIALSLCMVLTMMPMATGVAWADTTLIEDVTFNFAYDAQRTPTFPEGSNTDMGLYDLKAPLDNDEKDTAINGSWTLTKAGTYSYVGNATLSDLNLTFLNGIVNKVVTKYDLTEDQKKAIVIHELKKDGEHIAYGVVIAYSSANDKAVFIGDKWSSSGACYLLSKSEIVDYTSYDQDNRLTITAGEIATDFVQVLSIDLDHTDTHTFTSQTTETVKITNTGNNETGNLTVKLSGDNASSFILGKDDYSNDTINISNILIGGCDTFTVAPKTGLAAGTYTATVTVIGQNIVSKSFNVSYIVNGAALSSIKVTAPPTKTTYTAGEDFDRNGMEVTATYSDYSTKQVTEYTVTDGEKLTKGTTFITISYTEGNETRTATQDITVKAPSGGSYTPTIQHPTIIADEGAETTLSFYGTWLTIKVTDGYELADVILNGVSKGKVTELTGLKTGDKVEVKTEKKQEEPKEPTKEEIIAALDSSKLVARSKLITLKNGKKAVRVTWYDKNGKEVDFDGIEIYRSTQRYKGYGLKPFYATKDGKTEGYYVNTKDLKEGTTYYYKVRGYIEIDGQKYYTDYSLKAIRTVK